MNTKKAKAIRKLAKKMYPDDPEAAKQAHRLLKKNYLTKIINERSFIRQERKMSDSSSSSSGIGVFGLLGVAFVVLKLMGYITWSWWWVTAPFWGPLAFLVLFGIFAAAIMKS